jgi:hypothetical protein
MTSLETAAERPEPAEPLALLPAAPEAEADVILVFASTTEVLNAESRLEDRDLPFELVPVPKAVNPNCGLAISFAEPARPEIMAALDEGGFVPTAAYVRRGDDFHPLIELREEAEKPAAAPEVRPMVSAEYPGPDDPDQRSGCGVGSRAYRQESRRA